MCCLQQTTLPPAKPWKSRNFRDRETGPRRVFGTVSLSNIFLQCPKTSSDAPGTSLVLLGSKANRESSWHLAHTQIQISTGLDSKQPELSWCDQILIQLQTSLQTKRKTLKDLKVCPVQFTQNVKLCFLYKAVKTQGCTDHSGTACCFSSLLHPVLALMVV